MDNPMKMEDLGVPHSWKSPYRNMKEVTRKGNVFGWYRIPWTSTKQIQQIQQTARVVNTQLLGRNSTDTLCGFDMVQIVLTFNHLNSPPDHHPQYGCFNYRRTRIPPTTCSCKVWTPFFVSKALVGKEFPWCRCGATEDSNNCCFPTWWRTGYPLQTSLIASSSVFAWSTHGGAWSSHYSSESLRWCFPLMVVWPTPSIKCGYT